MSVDNVVINGTHVQEAEREGDENNAPAQEKQDGSEQEKGVVALSVKEKSEKGSQALQLAQKPTALPGNRPVEPSHLKVIGTYSSVGGSRPIAASGMDISSTLTVSGHRPIALSHLQISETYTVMGNRPVASNEIDEEPAVLMGYLD